MCGMQMGWLAGGQGSREALKRYVVAQIEAQLDGEVMSTMWNAMVEEVARMLLEESTQDCLVDFIVGFERVCIRVHRIAS